MTSNELALLPSGLIDANVLLQPTIRDTLLRCGEERLFFPLWSPDIFAAVRRNFARVARPVDDPAGKVAKLFDALDTTFPAAMITGYEYLLPKLTNHPGDRHVLAAAIHGGATHILTYNTRHFPVESLRPYRLTALTPDLFLVDFFRRRPALLWHILAAQGSQLRHPRTVAEVLDSLLPFAPHFVALVRKWAEEQ